VTVKIFTESLFSADLDSVSINEVEEFLALKSPEEQRPPEGLRIDYNQQGCLYREWRKAGPDVWVFRYRDGQSNRKERIGTVEQFPTKSSARKACELLRMNINRDTRSPRTVAELVAHYTEKELPNKTPYTAEVYAGYLKTWIQPMWNSYSLSDVRTVAVESWLGTLPLANGTRAKLTKHHARAIQSCDALGVFQPQSDYASAAISNA
jgi:hypothetical protein